MLGRVSINAAAVFASRVVAAASGLAIAYVVVERLGPAGFGRFAAVLAAGAIANVAQTFGVDTTVVRAVADRRDDATATVLAALRLQLLIGAVATVAVVGAVALGIASPLLVLPAVALFPLGVTTVGSAVIRGVQQMTDLLLAGLVSGVTSLALALWLIDDQVGVAVGTVVAGQAAGALFLAWRAFPHLHSDLHSDLYSDPKPDLHSGRRSGRKLLSETWIFAAATLASAVLVQGSIVIFGLFGEGSGAGLAAGLRLVEAARLVPAAVFAALFPAMFDGVHRTARYRRSFAWLVGYGAAATIGLVVLAPQFVRLFLDDLDGGVTIIRILALSVPITIFRLRFSFELIAAGKERLVLAAAVVAVIVAVAGYVSGSLLNSEAIVAWFQVIGGAVNAVFLVGAAWRATAEPAWAVNR